MRVLVSPRLCQHLSSDFLLKGGWWLSLWFGFAYFSEDETSEPLFLFGEGAYQILCLSLMGYLFLSIFLVIHVFTWAKHLLSGTYLSGLGQTYLSPGDRGGPERHGDSEDILLLSTVCSLEAYTPGFASWCCVTLGRWLTP